MLDNLEESGLCLFVNPNLEDHPLLLISSDGPPIHKPFIYAICKRGVVPSYRGFNKLGLIKHYNWHDAPFKGWEEVDTLYQNHHKAPKLVYPGGG